MECRRERRCSKNCRSAHNPGSIGFSSRRRSVDVAARRALSSPSRRRNKTSLISDGRPFSPTDIALSITRLNACCFFIWCEEKNHGDHNAHMLDYDRITCTTWQLPHLVIIAGSETFRIRAEMRTSGWLRWRQGRRTERRIASRQRSLALVLFNATSARRLTFPHMSEELFFLKKSMCCSICSGSNFDNVVIASRLTLISSSDSLSAMRSKCCAIAAGCLPSARNAPTHAPKFQGH